MNSPPTKYCPLAEKYQSWESDIFHDIMEHSWMICLYSCRIVLFGKSFASAGKQLPWRAARRPGGAAIGSALAPSGGGEAQRKISSNHMGTEFLWLRDKCLTSESWQEMMAINCFNARYITNVYSVYNVIKNLNKKKSKDTATYFVISKKTIWCKNQFEDCHKSWKSYQLRLSFSDSN